MQELRCQTSSHICSGTILVGFLSVNPKLLSHYQEWKLLYDYDNFNSKIKYKHWKRSLGNTTRMCGNTRIFTSGLKVELLNTKKLILSNHLSRFHQKWQKLSKLTQAICCTDWTDIWKAWKQHAITFQY